MTGDSHDVCWLDGGPSILDTCKTCGEVKETGLMHPAVVDGMGGGWFMGWECVLCDRGLNRARNSTTVVKSMLPASTTERVPAERSFAARIVEASAGAR